MCEFISKDNKSWIEFIPRFMPLSEEEFEEIWQTKPQERAKGFVMGKMLSFPRWTIVYGKPYTFSGERHEGEPLTNAPQKVQEFIQHISSKYYEHNSILLNFYESTAEKCDYIGKHSDDEKDLCPNSPIISLTWCNNNSHYRRFRLLPRDVNIQKLPPPYANNNDQTVLNLKNGDMLIMGGTCQNTHTHEIMISRKRDNFERVGRRINITVRHVL